MALTRGVPAPMLAALSGVIHPVILVWIDWPGAPVRAHSGVGTITALGQSWSGVGPLGGVDVPPESAGIAAVEAGLTLAQVPADLDGLIDDQIRGRSVALYLGALAGRPGGASGADTAGQGNTLIAAPVLLFSGLAGQLALTASAAGVQVTHDAHLSVITGQEARSGAAVHHSDEDQRRRYPADTAGRLVIMAIARAQKMTWPQS
ncbi:hypothetical protein ACEYYA_00955 [Paracoccus sp. p3-h83]|uniref:hypothetical protein n=1 Tax=Paracoccus sp. p3-h83 TaxID=3342805 RepID=UPI0035B8A42E